MNNAALYHRMNSVTLRLTKSILAKYGKFIKWKPDGSDTILDVGTGSGRVLVEAIVPILPKKYREIVGIDISPNMVEFAEKHYASVERAQFEYLDITTPNLPTKWIGYFDHIFALYSLNWVQDQKKALANISSLLKPGGDCVFIVLEKHPLYAAYVKMAEAEMWQKYMKGANDFVSPLYHYTDTRDAYEDLLQEAGFVDYSLELKEFHFVYETLDSLKDHFRSLSPFLVRIPETEQNNFIDDLTNTVLELTNCNHQGAIQFPVPHLLVYAQKGQFTGGPTSV